MIIRNAKISDAVAISELVASHAELDRMLFQPVSDVYEYLQTFKVAEVDSVIAGCCALQVVWAELGEIKSLAVKEEYSSRGIGRKLVEVCIARARELGIKKIFILTLEPVFFEKMGFAHVEMKSLPMKVWSDCVSCSKQDHCDEVAMAINL